jgi:hypothetical protein
MWVYVVVALALGLFMYAVTKATAIPPKKAPAIDPAEIKKKPAKVDITAKKHSDSSADDEKAGAAAVAVNLHKDSYRGHSLDVTTVALSPSGLWLASGSKDRTLRVWNLHDRNKTFARINLKDDHIRAIDVTADSNTIAALLDYTRKVQIYAVTVSVNRVLPPSPPLRCARLCEPPFALTRRCACMYVLQCGCTGGGSAVRQVCE